MEQKRLLLAITLSFAVFLVWSIVFGPKPGTMPEKNTEPTTRNEEQATESAAATEQRQDVENTQPPARSIDTQENIKHVERPARELTIETPVFKMFLTEKGAAVTQMVLKEYKETIKKNSPLKKLIPEELKGGTVLLRMTDPKAIGLEQMVYTTDENEDFISVESGSRSVRFQAVTDGNVTVEKTYRFNAESYFVDIDVKVVNNGNAVVGGDLAVGLRDVIDADKATYGFQGPSGLINDSLEQVKIKKIEKDNKIAGTIQWVAIEKQYFMDSLVSKSPAEGTMFLAYNNKILTNQLVTPIESIVAGQGKTFSYTLFMGPKSLKILEQSDKELARAINYGWFDFIAKPCLWFMNFIYGFIPNYGIAIILLTVISRLIFWPLAQKSYKSMSDMRKLQPLMEEIREKYKDDKVRMNEETMALYRTYKINPLGGCLPMLIQMPVFLALYSMLYGAFELRHAPFVGWIQDLSAPDRLFHFDISLPIIQPPVGIPVLTLIMGATMILQQKMSPAPGDPTQAKMMMLMPVIFTFIFINFPSGLVLYWLVSNLVAIAQQYYTQKKLA